MTRQQPAAPSGTYLQFAGAEYSIHDIEQRVRAVWRESAGAGARISRLRIYIKPEEQRVYYVVNNRDSGSLPLEALSPTE